jgi:DNA-binding transcriptional LysR family regulator
MELRQLRHFLAVVEERSITRAAKREFIVQSGLSNSLQTLERELGTPLYVRGTRPVRLTAAGEALVGPARRTLTSAAQAEQAGLMASTAPSGATCCHVGAERRAAGVSGARSGDSRSGGKA